MIEKRIKKVTSNPSLFSMPMENNLHKKSDIDEQKNLFDVEEVKKTARHSV
jgi:transaldolase